MTRLRSWVRRFQSIQSIDVLAPRKARRLLWAGLSLLFLGMFVKLSWTLFEGPELDSLDRRVLISISHLRVPRWNGPAVDITALGSPTVIGLFTLITLVILGLHRDRRGCAYLLVGIIGAGICTNVMKQFFTRPRPTVVSPLVEVSGFSYPSGHSLVATSFYLLLMFLAWRHDRRWSSRTAMLACAAVVIGGVCLSRLYLGVHYPSDVLSGALLGTAWVCLVTALFSRGSLKDS
jgi:undecaprenyl-diphosphatase